MGILPRGGPICGISGERVKTLISSKTLRMRTLMRTHVGLYDIFCTFMGISCPYIYEQKRRVGGWAVAGELGVDRLTPEGPYILLLYS